MGFKLVILFFINIFKSEDIIDLNTYVPLCVFFYVHFMCYNGKDNIRN